MYFNCDEKKTDLTFVAVDGGNREKHNQIKRKRKGMICKTP